MVLQKSLVSPQYLKESRISVTILEMKSPAHFIVKESPSVNISSEAKTFVETEETMQKFYHSIEPTFFQLPLKDSIVVVLKDEKFYRAKVRSIMTTSKGHLIRVYLVDYGIQCTVPRNHLFQIEQDFLQPFQAVEFKLLDVTPITLVFTSDNLDVNYGIVDDWDPHAKSYMEKLQEGMIHAHIKVRGVGADFLAGSLYMTFLDSEVKCINDELICRKYAQYNADCWDNVTKIGSLLSKMPVHHSSVLQGGSTTPISSSSGSSQTSPSSLALPKVAEQPISPHARSMTPPSSPNRSTKMLPNSPMFSKLPEQHSIAFQGYTTPISLPKKSPQVSPNALELKETDSPDSPRQHQNEFHGMSSSSQSNSAQASPNSPVKEVIKPNGSVMRLQHLLKLRKKRESMMNEKSPVEENKETEIEAVDKVVKESPISPTSSTSTSTSTSTSSDTCHISLPDSNRCKDMITPVRKVDFSVSNDKQSNTSLINLKYKLSSPKLRIALDTPINRKSIEAIKPNLPSEPVTETSTDQHSTEKASIIKTPPKTSLKFQDIKKFLYSKRISPSCQTQEVNTKPVENPKNISESKNEDNACHGFSMEDEKNFVEKDLLESRVEKDLEESLNLHNIVFPDEDDFLQCALNPEIKESDSTSPRYVD